MSKPSSEELKDLAARQHAELMANLPKRYPEIYERMTRHGSQSTKTVANQQTDELICKVLFVPIWGAILYITALSMAG